MGCPNFLASTTYNRRQTAISIKMCLNCLNPKITWKNTHHQNCTKAPAGDQCKFTGCTRNIWVCDEHKDDQANVAAIKNMKETAARQGWTLGMVSVMGRYHQLSPRLAKNISIVK